MNGKWMTFYKKHSFMLFMGIIFFFLLFIYILTPLLADDYTYSFIYNTTERVKNPLDIIYSQYRQYMLWGGRCVAHFFFQLFLMIGKPVLNVFAAFITTLLIYLVVYLATGRKKFPAYCLIISGLLMWLLNPDFSQTVTLQSGFFNYVFVTAIALIYLLPLRLLIEGNNVLKQNYMTILWFFMGVLAGWTNEMVAGASIFASLLFMICYKFLDHKCKLPLWSFTGLAGNMIGFAIMMASPGNALRSASMGGNPLDFVTLERRLTEAVNLLYDHLLLLYLLFIICYTLLLYQKTSPVKKIIPAILALTALAGHFCMILSPFAPPRVMFTGFVFITAAFLSALYELKIDTKWITVVLACSVTLFLFSYYNALVDSAHTFLASQRRIAYIQEQKAAGNLNITVPEITKISPYNAWEDMKSEGNQWPNADIAAYYGLESIVIEQTD